MSRAGRFVLLTILLFANAVPGQTNTPVPPPANQAIAEAFDVKAAVEAYLAKMPPAQRARSDAYFAGGYWLLLRDFLSTVVVMWFIRFQTEEDTVLVVSDHRVKVAERDLRFLIENAKLAGSADESMVARVVTTDCQLAVRNIWSQHLKP